MMVLVAFEDTEAAKGGRAKGLEEEFWLRFRKSAGLTENKRKRDFKVLKLRLINHLDVLGTVLSACLVFLFILILPILRGSSILNNP